MLSAGTEDKGKGLFIKLRRMDYVLYFALMHKASLFNMISYHDVRNVWKILVC